MSGSVLVGYNFEQDNCGKSWKIGSCRKKEIPGLYRRPLKAGTIFKMKSSFSGVFVLYFIVSKGLNTNCEDLLTCPE